MIGVVGGPNMQLVRDNAGGESYTRDEDIN